jgi:hypothetical protein
VSTSLSQALPESLNSLRTRSLFVLREQVPPLFVVGQTPNGFRRIGLVPGGSLRESDSLAKWSAATTGNPYAAILV